MYVETIHVFRHVQIDHRHYESPCKYATFLHSIPNRVQINETYTTERRYDDSSAFSKTVKQNFELRSYDPISVLRITQCT